MTAALDSVHTRLLEAIRSAVNTDGGWGYDRGKASRLEPTCWALLALLEARTAEVGDRSLMRAALTLLAARQHESGLLVDVPGALPNLAFNGLAAIVIRRAASLRDPGRQAGANLDALVSGILAGEGVRTKRDWINRQNNDLAAWPWHGGTSSWIEPTAWCMLALKLARSTAAAERISNRLADADRMLADRCCLSGGWNYGNSNMLGKELPPYVLTSALALLALQDRRALPEVARSIRWLDANWHTELSSGAMSLTMIAMTVFGRPTDNLERGLLAHLANSDSAGNLATCGMTCYALNGRRDGYPALTL